jgi:sulfur carrier protein ThiS
MFSGTMLRFVNFDREIEIPESNLELALQRLLAERPALRPVLLDGVGNLRRSHQMFLNGQSVPTSFYSDRQVRGAQMMRAEDTVYFLTAIAGG